MQTNNIDTWLEAELNRRHKDFQSNALPTELSSHNVTNKEHTTLRIDWGEKNIGLSLTIHSTKIIIPLFKTIKNDKFHLLLKDILKNYQIKLIHIGYFQKKNNPSLIKKTNELLKLLKNFNIPTLRIIEYYTTCTAKSTNKLKKKFNNKKKKNFYDILSSTFME